MTLIIIISSVLFIVLINYLVRKNREENLLNDIQDLYAELNEFVIDSYDLKICPKCFENVVNIRKISPTGKSVEYSCDYCGKIITSNLKKEINGSSAVDIFSDIKSVIQRLVDKTGNDLFDIDIDISFTINPSIATNKKRERIRRSIPESIRHEVWRRDEGKCIECGSKEKLEFDHIIPVSKGGANTTRNLQLL